MEQGSENKTAIIDLEVINAYLGPEDDISLISDLAEYFKKNAPVRLESARANYMSGNEKQFKYYLHALKNSFLNIGALSAAENCQELENAAGDLTQAEIETRLIRLEELILFARTEVSNFITQKSRHPISKN
jgi:hypothetical protein